MRLASTERAGATTRSMSRVNVIRGAASNSVGVGAAVGSQMSSGRSTIFILPSPSDGGGPFSPLAPGP